MSTPRIKNMYSQIAVFAILCEWSARRDQIQFLQNNESSHFWACLVSNISLLSSILYPARDPIAAITRTDSSDSLNSLLASNSQIEQDSTDILFQEIGENQHPISSNASSQSCTWSSPGNMKLISSIVQLLPSELIVEILSSVHPSTLYECALVCRRWNREATPILYTSPCFPTPKSLKKFLKLIESCKNASTADSLHPSQKYSIHKLPRSITFTQPQPQKTQSQSPAYQDMIRAQSSLFRLYVSDRHNPLWTFTHPVLIRLVSACENFTFADEFFYTDPQFLTGKNKSREYSLVVGSGTDIPTTSDPLAPLATHPAPVPAASPRPQLRDPSTSDSNLTNPSSLLTSTISCTRTFQNLCATLQTPLHLLLPAIKCMLGLFDRYDRECWGVVGVGRHGFEKLRECVRDKCCLVLKGFGRGVLMEVQYITMSSQKLLDAYVMLYYRTLSFANSLNLSLILETLQKAAQEKHETTPPVTAHPNDHALHILQALGLIFNDPFPIADSYTGTRGIYLTSRTHLREAILAVRPGSVNRETAELIETHLEMCVEPATYGGDGGDVERELWKCGRWVREVLVWQRCGRVMEPVKEMLRRSVGRIDELKGMQRRFGVVFLE